MVFRVYCNCFFKELLRNLFFQSLNESADCIHHFYYLSIGTISNPIHHSLCTHYTPLIQCFMSNYVKRFWFCVIASNISKHFLAKNALCLRWTYEQNINGLVLYYECVLRFCFSNISQNHKSLWFNKSAPTCMWIDFKILIRELIGSFSL